MALAIDAQTDSGALNNQASATWNHTGGGSPGLLVVRANILSLGASHTFTCTYNGSSTGFVQAFQHETDAGAFPIYTVCWYLLSPPGGTNQVVVQDAAGSSNHIWGVVGATTYTGNATSSPLSVETSQTGSGTADTVSFSSTSGNIVLDMLMQDHSNNAITVNQTSDFNSTPTGSFNGSGQHAAGTGSSISMSITLNATARYLHAAFEVQAASSGITFDASSNSGDQTSVSTFTFTRTVTLANPFLAVDVGLLSTPSATVSVIDDDGGGNVPMQFLGQQAATGIGLISMWGLANPVSGTKNIRVNLSTSLTSGAIATIYGGVDQAGPTESFNSAQGVNVGAGNASVVVTSITDKTWTHAATSTNDAAATNNQTSRGTVTDAVLGRVLAEDGNAAVTPAGATTMTAAVAALKAWAIAGYAIRPTGNDPLLMGQALL